MSKLYYVKKYCVCTTQPNAPKGYEASIKDNLHQNVNNTTKSYMHQKR